MRGVSGTWRILIGPSGRSASSTPEADLGLALARDAQQGLREDLRLR